MHGSLFPLEVQPRIPPELARLQEMANDLVYTWERSIRSLFHRLDRELWEACGHNPKAFLRRVSQHRLEEAVGDRNSEAHVSNLFDLNAKYADVLPLGQVLSALEKLPAR